MTTRYARLVKYDKDIYAIGGNWLAGGTNASRPKSMTKFLRDEGFDVEPRNASWVWLETEQQVGIFVFEGKAPGSKPKAFSLAAIAARRVDSRYPFVGLFCLGDDLWWLFATDMTGAVHPIWGDVWGTREEIDELTHSYTAELAAAASRQNFDSPRQAWDWLLASDVDVPALVPVLSGFNDPRTTKKIVVVAVAALAASGAFVLYQQQMQRLQEKAALEAQQAALQQAEAQRLSQEQQAKATREAVQQYWQNYPRPWKQPHISWAQLALACKFTPSTNGAGWVLTKVTCTPDASGVRIDREWVRYPFARVADAPGDVYENGSKARSTDTVTVQPQQASEVDPVASTQMQTWWADYGLKMLESGVRIENGSPTPFTPPYPQGTTEEIKAEMRPPVLWQQIEVTITTPFAPQENALASLPNLFLPSSIEISVPVSGNIDAPTWVLKGVQYANP